MEEQWPLVYKKILDICCNGASDISLKALNNSTSFLHFYIGKWPKQTNIIHSIYERALNFYEDNNTNGDNMLYLINPNRQEAHLAHQEHVKDKQEFVQAPIDPNSTVNKRVTKANAKKLERKASYQGGKALKSRLKTRKTTDETDIKG